MKTSAKTPEWATELFTEVCKDYNRGLPSLFTWHEANRNGSSGWTRAAWGKRMVKQKSGKWKAVNWYGEIKVIAGKDEQDQKLVLLHEIAHHLNGKNKAHRGEGHTMKFWKLAFELYDKYGVDMDYAYKREKGYKAKATDAYEQHIALKKEATWTLIG